MSLPACALLMSPEDQFSPAIHSREIALRLTKQYSKLWGACAERGPLDLLKAAGWSSEGLRGWGDFLEETSHCRRWRRKKKAFQGRSLFPSTPELHQLASLPCFQPLSTAGQHFWLFLAIGSAGNQDHGCSGGAAWRLALEMGRNGVRMFL